MPTYGRVSGATVARLHAITALAVCVLVPGLSWLDGTGSLAWTMYSGSGSYRLRIVAIDAGGSRFIVAPTALAEHAGSEMIPYLTGAEHWRVAPAGQLRRHFADLAPLACRVGEADAIARGGGLRAEPPSSIELTLETKRTLDAPIVSSSSRAPCRPDTNRH